METLKQNEIKNVSGGMLFADNPILFEQYYGYPMPHWALFALNIN